MYERQNALHEWLSTILGHSHFTLAPITGDASFRHYFRLTTESASHIVMDAPPDKESLLPFIEKGTLLREHGIHTPHIIAESQILGFMLLEDLGDEVFLKKLSSENAHSYYIAALNTLIAIQNCPATTLPSFNEQLLLQELFLFPEWFLKQYLNLTLTDAEERLLQETFHTLITAIKTQPQVFVHRDYHSRNLMVVKSEQPIGLGVIDFQDAVSGPITYDLVSLLKDCYIQWSPEQISDWLHYFYHHLPKTYDYTLPKFIKGFELCGLQRHLKVLGIFCRLHLRDNKPQYLKDLPLTFQYVLAALENQKELKSFYEFMSQRVYDAFIKVNR